ncbi:MAG: glycosyltransferase [Gemmatimonadales bacterium]
MALLARSLVSRGATDRLSRLGAAYRRTSIPALQRLIERRVAPWLEPSTAAIWRNNRIGWARYERYLTDKTLQKSLILKTPGDGGEKGVLYVSFEVNWLRLLTYFNLPQLLDDYYFVAASSSSPPDFRAHWALAHVGPDPIFCQVSNQSEVALHRRLPHGIAPLPIIASDWINPDFYEPRPRASREIDILMVAGWSPIKRHWLLFSALRKMRKTLRVVLIGQDMEGRTADDVLREAAAFGVAGRLEIIRDAPVEVVSDYLCNSKVSMVLSRREGSSMAVTESLFADTPVALVHNAHIGSRAYINQQTGTLVDPGNLARALSTFVEESSSYTPRAWALQHISCLQTAGRLNAILRAHAVERKLPWSQDIKPLCWRPDPIYARASDAPLMEPAYEYLAERHGVVVARSFGGLAASRPQSGR